MQGSGCALACHDSYPRLRPRLDSLVKALRGAALYTGKPGEPPRGAIGGAQKAVDAISRPGRYPGSRSAAITPKTSINPGLKSGLGDGQGVDRSHLRKDAAIRPALPAEASARIKILQTTLRAMPTDTRVTCYNRFVRRGRAGVWGRIMNALAGAHDARSAHDRHVYCPRASARCMHRSEQKAVQITGGLTSKNSCAGRYGPSARVEGFQTTLGAMHHGVLLGGHRLGVGLQDTAAAQETDGHRG